jgi:Kef-type K+ transport system membrane component KefB
MGRVPKFTENIFPSDSITYLNLLADFGLVIYLFLVGVETDHSGFRSRIKSAAAICTTGVVRRLCACLHACVRLCRR